MAIIRNRRRRSVYKRHGMFSGRVRKGYTYRKSRPSLPSNLRVPRFNGLGSGRAITQNGFAQSTRTKLKYVDHITLDASPTNVVGHHFVLNSLQDPNFTGIGHQPMGFDQYAAIYSHYRVYAVKWKITVNKEATTGTTSSIVGTLSQRANSIPTAMNEIVEKAYKNDKHRMVSGTGPPAVMRGFTRIAPLAGMRFSEYHSSSRTEAPVTTSPQETMYMTVWASSPDASGLNDPAQISVLVELTYYCEFREVNNIVGS